MKTPKKKKVEKPSGQQLSEELNEYRREGTNVILATRKQLETKKYKLKETRNWEIGDLLMVQDGIWFELTCSEGVKRIYQYSTDKAGWPKVVLHKTKKKK